MPDALAGEYICIKYPETEKTRLRARLTVTNISQLLTATDQSEYIDPTPN